MKCSRSSFNSLAHAMRSSAAPRLIRSIAFTLLVAASASYLFWSSSVSATARVWDGGGTDNNWDNAANWVANIPPASGDVAVFDATSSKDVTINVPVNIAGIQVGSGYNGTFSQTTFATVTLGASGYTQAGGTFAGGGLLATVTVNGPFTISGGAFNLSFNGLVVTGDFSVTGGSFTPNSGSVSFTGGNATIDVATTETFKRLSFNSTGIKTIAAGDTLIATDIVDLFDGSIDTGTLEAQAGVLHHANFDGGTGTISMTGGNVSLEAPGQLPNVIIISATVNTTGSGAIVWDGNLTVQGGDVNQGSVGFNLGAFSYSQSGGTFNGGTSFMILGNFILSGGVFNGPSSLNVNNNYTHIAGTFNHNNGSVFLGGTVNSTIDVPSGETFYGLDFNMNQATRTIAAGDVLTVLNELVLGNGSIVGGEIQAKAAVFHSATFGGGTSLLVIDGSATRTIFLIAPGHLPAVIINAPNATINTVGTGTVVWDGNLTVQGGTLNQGAVGFSLGFFSYSQSGGTYNGGSSSALTTNNFTISGGVFNSPGIVSVNNSYTRLAGTFNHNNGIVSLQGSSNSTIDVPSGETFYNLTVNANDKTKTIATGDILTVLNNLSLTNGTINGGEIDAKTGVSHNANFDGGTTLLVIDGSATRTITLNAGGHLPAVTINAPNATVNTAGSGTITGDGAFSLQAGTVNQGSVNFLWSGLYAQSGGTFNGGSGAITANSSFTHTGGTFTSTSSDLTVAGDFKATSGVFSADFNHNSGQVIFTGGNTAITVGGNEITLNRAKFNATDGATRTIGGLGGALEIVGMLTLTNGKINGDSFAPAGGLVLESGFDGGAGQIFLTGGTAALNAGGRLPDIHFTNVAVNTAGSGTVTFEGEFDVVGTTVINQAGVAFAVIGPYQQIGGTYNGGAAALAMSSSFFLSGGTFNRPVGTSRFSGDFTQSGGTFNAAGGPVVFDGGNATIDVVNEISLSQVTFDANDASAKTIAAGDTVNANGLLTLTNGNVNGGKVQALAGLAHSAGFDGGTGTVEVMGGNATVTGGGQLPNFNLKSPGGVMNTSGSGFLGFDGNFTLESGTVNQGNVTFSFLAYTQSGGTFSGGTVNLVVPSFTLTGGTFTSTSADMIVAGNYTHTAGTFNPSGGSVVFNGLPATIDVNVSETFHSLTFGTTGAGAIKTIAAGDTLKAANALTLSTGQVNGGFLEAQGPVSVSSMFGGGTTSMLFSGAADQTFSNTGGVNPSGAWTIGKSSGALTLASDLALGTGPLNISSGTLDQGASFNLTAGAIAISGGGTLKNLGTGDLTLFGNLTNAGQMELNGSGAACGGNDAILIRSSSAGTQRAWSGSGTFILIDVDVRDQAGTAPLIAYSSTNGGNNGANWDVRNNCVGAPTDADLELFEATGVDGQVLIHWQTGFEVDNLGFNLYRDDGKAKTRLNPGIIAGSALVVGAGTPLTAGRSYSWKDDGKHADSNDQYWLEALDLNGQSTWYGPIRPIPSAKSQSLTLHQQSPLLDQITTGEAQQNSTTLVEPKAVALPPAQMQAALQTELAGHAAIKLSITHEGWYTVSQPGLLAAGLAPRTDPRFLQLFVDGQELPIRVTGATDGSFDPGDAIEFYGIGIDSPYTNSHTYWLTGDQKPGKRIAFTDTGKGDPSPSSFLCTVERRDRVIYFSSLLNGDKENFFGPVISATAIDQSLNLRHVDPAADGRLELEVALQGVTAISHRVKVTLNGNDLGTLDFYGQSPVKMPFPVSQRDLREGSNELTLVSQNGASDISLVDNIRLAYWHTYAADNDSLRLTATGNQEIKLDGFTNPDIRVLDVTELADVQEVTVRVEPQSKSNYSAIFTAPGKTLRTLLASTTRRLERPAVIAANQPSSWRQASAGADLVIITPRSFFGALELLQAQRQAQGLSVALVDIEDVYDEFSNGQKTPQAVKDFLAFAKGNWKKAPRYVLLAGDASYDTKNYLGHGDGDLVPTRLIDTTYMEAASDDWLADFNNDGLTEMAVGRLPAGTADEAALLVNKLTAYAQAAPAEELLLVADENDGFSFESAIAQLQMLAPSYLRVNVIQRGSMDIGMARQQLQEGVNRGQMIVNYAGHGSLDSWRGHLLMNADANALTNGSQLSLFVMMTCLNGYYIDPGSDSMAEALLKAEKGGAVAVWASSGMTLPIDQAVLNQQLFRLLFSQAKIKGTKPLTMGEAAMQAKAAIRDIDVRTTWIFFGDPTMRLK